MATWYSGVRASVRKETQGQCFEESQGTVRVGVGASGCGLRESQA